MDDKRVYVDFHVIQTVPPSCVNRDDTGSPKTAFYGGVQRARVSSQSWKKAIRSAFKDSFHEDELGVRTKKIIEMVKDRILNLDSSKTEEEAQKLAKNILEKAGVTFKTEKVKKGEEEREEESAKALFFMSNKQADNMAELALDETVDSKNVKKLAQAALRKDTGVDVALFGRMVADDPSLNTDACCQVAHAISTHRVDNEYDYFTAVDDKSPEDSAGAGMIGTVEYNSSTLYRYATIAAHELFFQLDNSQETTAKVVKSFAQAFITSMPTGKQNTFANRTLPDAVVVTVRTDQPINMVGAYEDPVKGGEDVGFVKQSQEKMVIHMQKTATDYLGVPKATWVIGEGVSTLGKSVSLPTLLDNLEDEMKASFVGD